MRIKLLFLILFIGLFAASPAVMGAGSDSLALTVTPPLMKINMEPGETMATAIKVVNNNNRKETFYAKVVDFRDKGKGEIEFLNKPSPVSEDDKNVYLSQWVTLSQEKLELDPFRPAFISFTITVPETAQPGGHYAAILVGTRPPETEGKGAEIKVSSYISSLILLRISGAIEEKGMIREFVFSNRFYQGGEGSFRVRFQNSGNVHLQPTGNIKVYDMFGKLKGEIDVNNQRDFGNVLPQSERTWDNLKWEGEDFFLINRYKAELAMTYGEEAKQTDYQTFFFWGVNLKWLAILGAALLVLLILIVIFIRFYIRQSVKNLKKQMGMVETGEQMARGAEEKTERTENKEQRADSKEQISDNRERGTKQLNLRTKNKSGEKKVIDLRKKK